VETEQQNKTNGRKTVNGARTNVSPRRCGCRNVGAGRGGRGGQSVTSNVYAAIQTPSILVGSDGL